MSQGDIRDKPSPHPELVWTLAHRDQGIGEWLDTGENTLRIVIDDYTRNLHGALRTMGAHLRVTVQAVVQIPFPAVDDNTEEPGEVP